MSSVASSAPLSLIWRGTWQASGVNSNGYQRYDCVTHAVTSPTARTDIYFAVTEIASGGAEPNPTSGQTTWKVLLEGGTIAASDGSIVYHDSEGNNVLVQAAADRILEVVNGIPEFVQRDPAPVATFEGYKLPSASPNRFIPTANAYWISGDRVFGLGTMWWEGSISSTATNPTSFGQRITPAPVLFAPRDDDAQVPIGKIFHGYRCVFAIGKDDKSKVYGLGLNAGRFGDGTNDLTTVVYDSFQKIQFFEDNGINIETIVSRYAGSGPITSVEASENRTGGVAIAYFIQEIVDVGGVDTGGNVYISAPSGLGQVSLAGGLTRDATIRQLTGFDQPIVDGTMYASAARFWSKRKIYALGRSTTTTAGGAEIDVSTVTELGSFDSDIVHVYFDYPSDSNSATVTLADGRAYYLNYKPPSGTRTTTLFEQIPVIDGKLYRRVALDFRARRVAAVMDDGSLYYSGIFYEGSTQRNLTPLTEVELPFDIQIRDAYFNRDVSPVFITTDGDVLANLNPTHSPAMIQHANYMTTATVGSVNMTLWTDPGWVGRADNIIFNHAHPGSPMSIQTEDGYIYHSNTIGTAVDEDDDTISTVLTNTFRPIGVNFQAQVYYTSTTANTVLAGSYRDADANAFTGLMSYSAAQTDFSIQINGSMVQRPTLRSYQIT